MAKKKRTSVVRESGTVYGTATSPSALRRDISAGQFKARCLAIMDEVRSRGSEYVITKRGVPVAKLVPVTEERRPLLGSMKGTATTVGDIVSPLDAGWEALDRWDDGA